MERFRVRASYNNNVDPNNFFHSKAASSSHLSLPPKPPISPQASLSRRIHDAEISIFDAERYFNGLGVQDSSSSSSTALKKKNSLALTEGVAENSVDVISTNPRGSSVSSVDGGYGLRNSYSRIRSFRATPTASSEASWNSQTGLLANPPGAVAVSVRAHPLNETKKGSGSSTSTSSFRRRGRSFFRRHCPCYGKKSVDVEGNLSGTRSPVRSHYSTNASQGFPKMDVGVMSNNSGTVPEKETMESTMTKFKIRATEPGLFSLQEGPDIGLRNVSSCVGGFSFPVLISPAAVPPIAKELEEPARESLEVFRPSEEPARTPRKQSEEVRRPVHEDDAASDTSSDLFELESFSANTSAYRRRDSLEELAKFAATATAGAGMLPFRLGLEEEAAAPPSECYAPSEASVEWSVTTAEAGFDRTSVANFSSAASDCGEVRFARTGKERSGAAAGNGGGAVKKRGGGGLLSCRSEKAVSVGPNQCCQNRTGPTVRAGRTRFDQKIGSV